MRPAVAVLFCIVFWQVMLAQEGKAPKPDVHMYRAVVFAVQQEFRSDHLEGRSDLCLGLGYGLRLSDKRILSQLRDVGIKLRPLKWCNHGPRGMAINVKSPIEASPDGTYTLVVELGDFEPIRREGAHFATLVREGIYVVKCCTAGAQLELVSYSRTVPK